MSSFFERVIGALFGGAAAGKASEADQQMIDDTIEAFVDTVEPRVRLRSGYREKLAGNVRRTIDHLREIGRARLEPVVLGRGAWSDDPQVRAYFAAADDIPECIGRSDDIRRFFEAHPECQEAHALLGMRRAERQILAPRLEGEAVRHDVAQTTVSFSGHRLLAPAAELEQTRLEVGRRILQRLAQMVLARIVAIDEQAKDLHEHKAWLGMRLRMLQRARDGMQPLAGEGPDIEQQIHELERALKETTGGYLDAKRSLATLDGYIEQMNAVLGHPEEHVALVPVHLRLNRMGVKVDPGSPEQADDLELNELSLGKDLRVTIALVRIPRAELPPKEDLLGRAEQLL
jgi:hypothetical protein